MFKSDLLPEEYLNLHIQKYQRSLFAQFRAGILPLHVETGRFRNLPLEQRLCVLCDKSEVEDEYYFLCQCAVYRDLRRILYSTTKDLYPEFEDMDDLEKFVFLNSNLQKHHVIVFITSAVLRRRTLLFHWGDLVLACALVYIYIRVYDSWHISPTGLGDDYWIICCICITISHVTLIKIMLCYVYVMWPWWSHEMETFSTLLAICAGNSPVTGELPGQRPVTRSFDVFFDLRLNKRLSKQSWGWWFDMPSRPLWRHCNGLCIYGSVT